MKFTKMMSLVLVLACTLAGVASAADIFSVKTALNMSNTQKNCDIPVLSGEVLEFSAEDLELRLGLEPQSLGGLTVTALPGTEQGTLILEGVDVDPFEFVNRDDIDKLCFVPGEDAVAASITILPRAENVSATELSISVLAEPNSQPELQDVSVDASKNVAVSGYLSAYDPDGDTMSVRVLKAPNNGTVRFDGLAYKYTPYQDFTGKDSFTVCVVDAKSNFSKPATINVNVEKPKNTFAYADMATHPSAYAAIKLREVDVMSGEKIGGKYFFSPDEMTTRGEFIVMLLVSGGFEAGITPTVNTGLPNDQEIPHYLKAYVKKAIDENIWSATQPFYHSQIPTRAEAVVLVDRAAKITDVRDFTLKMADLAALPHWSVPSYKNLAAYRMLDLHSNMANPADALTNGYCADLLWQLWKHCNR